MKILIVGAGVVNKGAETMIRTVQCELGKRIENATFFVEKSGINQGTENQLNTLGISIIERIIPNKINRLLELLVPVLFFPSLALEIFRRRDSFWGWSKVIKEMDGIIDISGYRYGESWGLKYAMSAFPAFFYSWLERKPYIFLPQAWGPFEKQTKVFRICRWMCKRSALFYARDKQSQKYLGILLDEEAENIPLAPDIAFLFTPSNIHEYRIEEMIKDYEFNKRLVAIVPNMRIYERAKGKGVDNIYIRNLINLCNLIIENGQAIVLIPHEINPQPNAKDDRYLSNLIYEKVENKSKTILINDVVSADYLKVFLSKCGLIISSRFHAVVAALELCKPVVVIGWSHKYEELLNDVGLGEFVLDYDEEITKLVEIVQKAEKESSLIISKLELIKPTLKNKVGSVFDQVSSLLSG